MKKIIQKNIEIVILILIILIASTILFIKMSDSNNKDEKVSKHAISNESELDNDINVLNNSASTGVSIAIGIPIGTPQTITPPTSIKNVIINNSLNKTQNNSIIKTPTNTSTIPKNTVISNKSDTKIDNVVEKNNSNTANQSTINSTTKENKVEITNPIKTDTSIKNTSSNPVSATSKENNTVKNINDATVSTYTSLGTYKILNKFSGYKYDNVYLLSNGQAYIQNDFITESTIAKNNEEAELRIRNSVSTLYSLYVKSMKKEIKVYKMSTTQSHVVFPQREYDYNAKQLEIFTGSLSYENKLKDIKNNWTNLKVGRVIQLANSSVWEQTSTEFSTFSPNAIAYHISYGVYDYLYIDGVDELISVKKYWY